MKVKIFYLIIFKENVIQARKKANPEIILHEMKRDIELKKLTL